MASHGPENPACYHSRLRGGHQVRQPYSPAALGFTSLLQTTIHNKATKITRYILRFYKMNQVKLIPVLFYEKRTRRTGICQYDRDHFPHTFLG
jgi:hypothetical protein